MIQKEDYLVFWTWTVEWMLLELLHYLVQMWWFKEYWKNSVRKLKKVNIMNDMRSLKLTRFVLRDSNELGSFNTYNRFPSFVFWTLERGIKIRYYLFLACAHRRIYYDCNKTGTKVQYTIAMAIQYFSHICLNNNHDCDYR